MGVKMWSLSCGVFIAAFIVSYNYASAHIITKRHYDFANGADIEAPVGVKDDLKEGAIQTAGKGFIVKPGASVRFECEVKTYEEEPIVNWYKVGEEGKGDTILFVNSLKMMNAENPLYYRSQVKSGSRRHELFIIEARPSDAGEYRCTLVQSRPSSVQHSLKVRIVP